MMMANMFIGISIFFILGIIMMTQPWQIFERNGNSMVRMVREKPSYRIYLKTFGCVLIALSIIFCVYSIYPKKIHTSLTGIKFKAQNTQAAESVNIEIDGELTKRMFKNNSEFSGKIVINGKAFEYLDNSLKLDKNGMGVMDYNDSGNMNIYGNIFVNERFKEITIEIYNKKNGGYSWSSSGGDLITAPCSNRDEAVTISNDLIQKVNDSIVIH
jgi:hypothetical protein